MEEREEKENAGTPENPETSGNTEYREKAESAGDTGASGKKTRTGTFRQGFAAGILAALILIAAILGAVTGGLYLGGRAAEKKAEASEAEAAAASGRRQLDMQKLTTKLSYMQKLVNQYFLYDDADEEDSTDGMEPEDWIYLGYVASLGDPYAAYYSAEDYSEVQEDTQGEYCGIGVLVSQNATTGVITVSRVFAGSPAEEAGMLPEDILYSVGDYSATGADLERLINEHIKGEEGTKVSITVYRASTSEYVDLEVERRIVEVPTVESEMLNDHVGYISLSTFDGVSTEQFTSACDELILQGMEKLVIDLRNNTGGLVSTAEGIADYLLPDGLKVVSFKGKDVPEEIYTAKDGHEVDLPIAVLVNGSSASASEVLTGALADNDRAIIVGTQTFGKGISQGIFRMNDGSALKLTTAYYYTPSGTCIHEIGITPDVIVELAEELRTKVEIPKDEDNQLIAAVDALEKGADAVNAELKEAE